MSGWERIAVLARAVVQAAAGRRWDEILELQAEQQQLLAGLPPADPAARGALDQALAATLEGEQLIAGAFAERKAQLERLRGGRRAIGAYSRARRSSLDARA